MSKKSKVKDSLKSITKHLSALADERFESLPDPVQKFVASMTPKNDPAARLRMIDEARKNLTTVETPKAAPTPPPAATSMPTAPPAPKVKSVRELYAEARRAGSYNAARFLNTPIKLPNGQLVGALQAMIAESDAEASAAAAAAKPVYSPPVAPSYEFAAKYDQLVASGMTYAAANFLHLHKNTIHREREEHAKAIEAAAAAAPPQAATPSATAPLGATTSAGGKNENG